MSGLTVSQRLSDQLSRLIAGTVSGDRLPSEPELAEKLGVSRATLREAMRAFETQGIIRRKQGSGTYVNHPAQILESGIEVLESIETMAVRSGLTTTMGELSIDQRLPSPEEQKILELEPSQEVIQVSRVMHAEGRPVAYLVDILPVEILSPADLGQGFTGSILDILMKHPEASQLVSRTEINAVTATSQVARALGIQRGDVLLHFIADLYSNTGKAIDHSFSYFLPGYFRFHVVRRVG
jgi:GntR family transcriptional regulator